MESQFSYFFILNVKYLSLLTQNILKVLRTMWEIIFYFTVLLLPLTWIEYSIKTHKIKNCVLWAPTKSLVNPAYFGLKMDGRIWSN